MAILDDLLSTFSSKANSAPYVWTICAMLLVAIATRAISAHQSSSNSLSNGVQTTPSVPYWLPFVGHIPNMAYDTDSFMRRLRETYRGGIFSLNFGGSRHNIIYSPDLVTTILNSKSSDAGSEDLIMAMLRNIFGMSRGMWKDDRKGFAEIVAKYKIILSEPGLSDMVRVTEQYLRQNIKDLVTGNESEVDMMPWEKVANVEIRQQSSGETIVEADLLALLREFMGNTATSALIGSNLLENYPDFLTDLWTLDRAFVLMAAGLPRWVPITSVTRAHIARRRMLERLSVFHEMMQREYEGKASDPKWPNLDNVSTLIKARNESYREFNIPIAARAALDLGLLWGTNANSNSLIFWLILRIFSDKALLALIREEIAPYVQVVQPEQELAFAEPARVENLDLDGLCTKCPLLKSCYIECLRLDAAPWSLKIAQQDFTLQSRAKNSSGWRINKGDYCHAAHDLHSMDPMVFDDPTSFKPDRHIKRNEETHEPSADMGSIKPFGGGSSMCKGRAFAFKELMLFAAVIISMWEIEPAKGSEWNFPEKRRMTAVYGVKKDVRVRLRHRKFGRMKNET